MVPRKCGIATVTDLKVGNDTTCYNLRSHGEKDMAGKYKIHMCGKTYSKLKKAHHPTTASPT
jgi:hypothetical protein